MTQFTYPRTEDAVFDDKFALALGGIAVGIEAWLCGPGGGLVVVVAVP